jgi:chemotaxis protein methyltransferase CheR
VSSSLSAQAVEDFRILLGQRLGFRFDDTKLAELSELLRERMRATHARQAGDYFDLLTVSAQELQAVAGRVTVPETYFFRVPEQFRAFVEVVLPERSRAGSGGLRFLSAGCASGEEPYSMAMLAREHLDLRTTRVSLRGVDINAAVIAKARQGRYSEWSLRETPINFRKRYFRAAGRWFHLDETIRGMVTFEQGNLLDANAGFWQREAYDAIFFRNVLMYFTPQAAEAVVANLASSLAPEGYLFLGPAENLRGLSQDFHLCHTHDVFYYQRRDEKAKSRSLPPARIRRSFPVPQEVMEISAGIAPQEWQQQIHSASQRIAELANPSANSRPRASRAALWAYETREPQTSRHSRAVQMGMALELLKQERYAEALAAIGDLAETMPDDSDVQLLRAVLLLNASDVAGAEASCRELLRRDELNAGAHYVRSMCLEYEGKRSLAIEEIVTAVYLDPSFAMARLQLGFLLRRTGDWEGARRELSQAGLLLAREDSSRILLFGGGFSREALVQLCQAELQAVTAMRGQMGPNAVPEAGGRL